LSKYRLGPGNFPKFPQIPFGQFTGPPIPLVEAGSNPSFPIGVIVLKPPIPNATFIPPNVGGQQVQRSLGSFKKPPAFNQPPQFGQPNPPFNQPPSAFQGSQAPSQNLLSWPKNPNFVEPPTFVPPPTLNKPKPIVPKP
jgi:hypothetical protein